MRVIPLSSEPAQDFTVVLNKTAYDFHVQWSDVRKVWTVDIADNVSKSALVAGASLLLGVNVLASYALGMGALFCYDASGADEDAGEDDLGDRVLLVYYTPREWPYG